LHSGLKILRDLKTKSAADKHIVAKSLAPAFIRLSIQAILYIERTGCTERKAFSIEMKEFSEDEEDIPENFTSLEEARDLFNQTVNGLFRVFYSFNMDLPNSAHLEIFPLHARYTKQLGKWNRSFEKFMQSNNSRLNSRELRGAAMLKIQHMTANIMAHTTTPNPDDPRPISEVISEPELFEPYNPDFETILQLSRSLVAASEEDSKSGRSPLNFSADLGIVGPLYYCCVKPTDQRLRLAAMELLYRCQRREGMWDSSALVPLIQGYWEIEKRHEALQDEIIHDNGEPVSLVKILDLVFRDGMKWEWKWKNTASTDMQAASSYSWAEVLEDRTLASVQEREKNNQ
jgi:hypothetical protein